MLFFFQAEDGIRDLIVTGVQTCALPISGTHGHDLVRAAGDDQVMGDAPRVEHLIVPAAHGDMVRLLVLEILLDEELRGEVVEALDLGHGATPQARGVTAALRPAAYRRRLSSRPRSACWGKSAPACTLYAPASPARSGRGQWPSGALGPPARRAATTSSPGRSVGLPRRGTQRPP